MKVFKSKDKGVEYVEIYPFKLEKVIQELVKRIQIIFSTLSIILPKFQTRGLVNNFLLNLNLNYEKANPQKIQSCLQG